MRSPLVPRVLGALTAAYGAYTFGATASPSHGSPAC